MLRSEVNSYSPWGANDADGSDYWWKVKAFHCVGVWCLLLSSPHFHADDLSSQLKTGVVLFSTSQSSIELSSHLTFGVCTDPAGSVLTIQDSVCSSGPIYTFVYQDAIWGAILALDISALTCPLQRPGISPATFHQSTAEPQLLVDTKLHLQMKMIYLFAFYIRRSAFIFSCGPTRWFPLMTVGVEPQR